MKLLMVELEHCDECFWYGRHVRHGGRSCACTNPECDHEAWERWYDEQEISWPEIFNGCPLPEITGDPES